MNVNRKIKVKMLIAVEGLTPKQAYEASKGIKGKRKEIKHVEIL